MAATEEPVSWSLPSMGLLPSLAPALRWPDALSRCFAPAAPPTVHASSATGIDAESTANPLQPTAFESRRRYWPTLAGQREIAPLLISIHSTARPRLGSLG
ncbi:hypothetical protein BS50DRAFT_629607 [Corynespora cassiicola Philippines]|uniref:Uncharacterized protein n=1 Tax=Corynespora cassiicola Philippines TaxID=1448308 RepID=A0A2T2P7E7_CORCC|nr:hypothetical protein BS50DRAFT_629607 [Corynespora cassiicola Philippines]